MAQHHVSPREITDASRKRLIEKFERRKFYHYYCNKMRENKGLKTVKQWCNISEAERNAFESKYEDLNQATGKRI